jgi:hypothetical protein
MKLLLIAAAVFSPHMWASAAQLTNSNIDTRNTLDALSFADLTFSGASYSTSTSLQFHGSPGDSGGFKIVGFAPGKIVSVKSGAGIAISGLAPADSAGNVSYTTTIVGATDQTITQAWTVSASQADPLKTFRLTRGEFDGLNTLELKASGNGFLKAGGPFDFAASIPGNWSTLGNSTGQVQLLNLSAELTILKNFTFDAATNLTYFEVRNYSYNGSSTVSFDFMLFGSPVPEPASYYLMGIGLVAIGARRKVRSWPLSKNDA